MDDKRLVRLSKYLSKHLRHQPEALGLALGPGGWVGVDELLAACAARSIAMSRAELDEVVARNNKQRFAFDETGRRIRASQGHSVEIDLELAPAEPPAILYHGTARHNLDAILAQGLRRMNRHHVHLSQETATAANVGGRHGKPLVLEVAAGAMRQAGHVFYCSANGVWLTDEVPPAFLRPIDGERAADSQAPNPAQRKDML